MNEKTGTGVSSEKENVKESQSRSVTPSLDTPLGAGLGRHMVIEFRYTNTLGLDHELLFVVCFVLNILCDMCGDLCE